MKKEKTLGVVRHVLTFVGGIVVMKGFASDSTVQEIIGTALTLVGSIWSVVSKQKVA
jgi:hypothetical protein